MSTLHRFIFEGMPVRGMLVRLTDDWREVLRRRQASDTHPPPVRSLLGQMAAAGVLMQASIRFNGALVLQVFGDGPVKLAVAEVQSDLAFRVTGTVKGDVAPDAQLEALLNVNGGGRCAITLDPKVKLPGQQPYQGVVPLHGDRREPLQQLSQVLEHYMLQSEQLDTRLVLAADDDVAAGLLIQRMPVSGAANLAGLAAAGPPQGRPNPLGGTTATPAWGQASVNEDEIGLNEDFNRIALLAATLTPAELLRLDPNAVLHRLFWEESVRLFEPQAHDGAPRFACTCSRARVGRMLLGLGADEVHDIVREQGRVEIGCEFCGLKYHFDEVDVGGLFSPPAAQAPGSSAIN